MIDPSWQEDGPFVLLARDDAVADLLADGTRTLLWIVGGEKHMSYAPDQQRDWREIQGILWLEGAHFGGRLRQKLHRAREAFAPPMTARAKKDRPVG